MTFPGVNAIIKPILIIVNSHKSQINLGEMFAQNLLENKID